jgi:hypothetical protein
VLLLGAALGLSTLLQPPQGRARLSSQQELHSLDRWVCQNP